MIWVPISHNSRGSTALTLPCVPTDMKTGVSTTPCGVVSRPRRALEEVSVLSNSNMAARVYYQPGGFNCKSSAPLQPPFAASTAKTDKLHEYKLTHSSPRGWSGGGLVPAWTYPGTIEPPIEAVFDHQILYNSA